MKVTESQLRKIIKGIIKEQATPSNIPVRDPNTISSGQSYGHTESGIEYAPEGMTDEDAASHLRGMFASAPLWKFMLGKDPSNGRVYAYYEIDTSN